MNLFVSFIFGFLTINQVLGKEPPIVKIHSGQVQGYNKTISFEDREVFIYEGIPYAAPPIGELRFQKTKPVANWNGVYKANKYRAACQQSYEIKPDNGIPLPNNRSEDCLYLSVYRPATDSENKRAVMVWIYGGGFETGSAFSLAYDASYLSSIGDVVVVTMNYRLGAFGFMYAGDELSPGNQGIYDQLEALKWVKTNIEQFGGDPNLITLFGESAGSISTGTHILSPLSKGLFQRAIMQSGTPNSYFGSESPETALEKTKSLAEKMDCPTSPIVDLIKCMRGKSAEDIVEMTKAFRYSAQTLKTVYNTEIITKNPKELLAKGEFATDVDVIFGLNQNEGSLFAEVLFENYLSPFIEHPNFTKQQAHSLIEFVFMIFHLNNATAIADYYLKDIDESDVDVLRGSVGTALGDFMLVCPAVFYGEYFVRHSNAKSNNNNVYSYRLTRRTSFPALKECVGYMGVCHGDDILYVFGFPVRLRGIVYSEEDYNLSMNIMKSWAHFARHGNPGLFGSVQWDPVVKPDHTDEPIAILKMDTPALSKMLPGYYKDVCDTFWKPILFPEP